VYALVIDCFSRAIVGWQVSKPKDTAMVTTALKMALWRRDHHGHTVGEGLIHHSDAGSQGGFNRSSQHRLVRAAATTAVVSSLLLHLIISCSRWTFVGS
jgi:transposase InsO family protein